jgi:formate C-acetyltransferase
MSTERTERLLKAHLQTPRWISVDRAQLYTDAFIDYASDPLPIRRAKAFQHVLQNIPIAIHPEELLVGGLTERPNGAILFPEVSTTYMKPSGKYQNQIKKVVSTFSSAVFKLVSVLFPCKKGLRSMIDLSIELMLDSFETRPTHSFKIDDQARKKLFELVNFWSKKSAVDIYQNLLSPEVRKRTGREQLAFAAVHQFTGGVKQFSADFGMVIEKGIESILMEAKAGKARGGEKARFYQASIIALEVLLSFADRYASLADLMANATTDANEREDLLRIAEICHRVPRRPAKTFREAFQSFWFLYLALVFDDGGMEIPFGRLDQVLWPYYRDDLAAGRLTEGEAKELVEAFFVKASEMEFLLDNGANRVEDGSSARMTLTLGGIGRDGRDATNELSAIFLDVAEHARTLQPNVAVRIHPQTSSTFYHRVIDVVTSGANAIQLFNDEVIIAGLTQNNIALEDARDYAISGCVQPLPFGAYGSTCASHIYVPRTLLLFMAEHKLSYQSFQEFMTDFKAFFKKIVANDVSAITAADKAHLLSLPNPLVSALVPGSLEKGIDVKQGGARYNLTGVSLSGTGTFVDSLQAIETLVFNERTLSFTQLAKMMKKDFYGSEIERQMILNKVPKYGNDLPEVDKRAGDFTRFVADEFAQYRSLRGGKFLLGMHTEANHVLFGLLTGATPDGRHQGKPFSVGAGSTGGRDRSGYTAFLNSMLNHDFSRVCAGSSVNIRVNPKLLEGESQKRRFSDLIRTYFQKGGPQFQANVVSTETLRKAQLHAENYGDLLVRVSGFCARFVELTRQTQDEIISRSEQS